MALAPGTKLGPYEIVAALGAGGMGEVYRARDTRLGREVAIKIVPARLAHDAAAVRRFEQEARAVAALNHPNLLTIHDFGTTEAGELYMVTELLEGATLRHRLTQGSLGQRLAADYGAQIARGLAAAHDKGIIHRDLKPDNIFVTEDGRAKILDFGLAKLAADTSGEAKTVIDEGTAAGTVLGTVGYMAPEQARGQAADHRSDIFSLGCVLYEMTAGCRAFRGDSAADVISAILREEPPEIGLSGVGLERTIRHCLEKEPRQRFQSASDVAFNLAEGGGSAMSISAAAITAANAEASPRWRIAAIAAVGLVVGAAAAWWLFRKPASTPTFTRLTYQQGVINSARFLPDGQGFVLTAEWNNQLVGLYTGRFDSPGLQPLAAEKVSEVLAVGAGEMALLSGANTNFGYTFTGTLARMPLGGGAPRAVLDHVQFADYAPGTTNLAITREHAADATSTLEYPIGHVLFSTQGWIGPPRFSPDGRQIAFQVHPRGGDDMGYVAVTDLAGHVKRLSRQYASTRGLAWAPSGKEIWFTAGDSPLMSLHAVTLSGHERLVAGGPGILHLFDIRADGRALVASETARLAADLVTPDHPQPRDFTVLDWSNNQVLSADGKLALIGDEDSGVRYSTYLRNADGSPPVRLGDGDPIAISPDGQWAASVLPTTQQIQLLPTGAGESRALTHGDIAFDNHAAAWLPDGKALIVLGTAPGQGSRIYRVGLDGAATPATPEGVSSAGPSVAVTPDGRAVVARRAGGAYQLYPLAGGAPQPLPALRPGDFPLRFSGDGRALYVERTPAGQPLGGSAALEIWRVDLATRQRQRMYTTTPDASAGVLATFVSDISADGKSYTTLSSHEMETLYLLKP